MITSIPLLRYKLINRDKPCKPFFLFRSGQTCESIYLNFFIIQPYGLASTNNLRVNYTIWKKRPVADRALALTYYSCTLLISLGLIGAITDALLTPYKSVESQKES